MFKIKTPSRFQTHASECAAVCVGIVLEYYGYYFSNQKLRNICHIGRDGATIAQINQGVKELGHDIKISKKGVEALKRQLKPVIIHWNQHHFVVLEGITERFAYINDPAIGKYKLSIESFSTSYTGLCIEILCEKATKKHKQDPVMFYVIKELFSSIRIWKVAFSSLLPCVFMLLFYGHVSSFFDYNVEFEQRNSGILLSLSALFLLILYVLVDKLKNELSTSIIIELANVKKERLLKNIGASKSIIRDFYASELASRIDGFHAFFKNTMKFALELITQVPSIILALLLSTLINPFMAILSLFPCFLSIIFDNVIAKNQRAILFERDGYDANLQQQLSQCLAQYNRFYSMGVSQQFVTKIMPYTLLKQRTEYRRANYVSFAETSLKLVEKIQYPILMLAGLYQVLIFDLTFGQVLFSVLTAIFIQHNLIGLWKSFLFYQESKQYASDSDDFILEEETPRAYYPYKEVENGLLVSNLSLYSMALNDWIFHDISIVLKKGHWLCIAGESGVGKTTLLELLSLQRKSDSGDIEYFSVSADYTQKAGYVFAQQDTLFGSLSMYFTINNCFDIEGVTTALSLCQLADKLSYHLEHVKCNTFSNLILTKAERQQLAIAKAFYFNNKLLMIDEAFSHINSLVALKMIQGLKSTNVTVVLVTHREDIKKQCDLQISIEK